MRKHLIFSALIVFLLTNVARATTWKDPWAEELIRKSSSFVLAKITASDEHKGISITIIKTLGGKELKGDILIDRFYMLTICSSSGGHGPEFHTAIKDSCYFFLYEDDKGHYGIPTPTTGFDYVDEGDVVSTYRHSYHQAQVPVNIYEKTMTAIFRHYHNQDYDKAWITNFTDQYLSVAPAGFSKTEINTFFLQHVALETVYHLSLPVDAGKLLPFLSDKKNFHNQVSGARALSAANSKASREALLDAIGDTSRRDFVKVMCIRSLEKLGVAEYKARLQQLEQSASDDADSFGGNIMDPGVCTSLPSTKGALAALLAKM